MFLTFAELCNRPVQIDGLFRLRKWQRLGTEYKPRWWRIESINLDRVEVGLFEKYSPRHPLVTGVGESFYTAIDNALEMWESTQRNQPMSEVKPEAVDVKRYLPLLAELRTAFGEWLGCGVTSRAMLAQRISGIISSHESAELAKLREENEELRKGAPLGPIIGANTIVDQEIELKALRAELAEAKRKLADKEEILGVLKSALAEANLVYQAMDGHYRVMLTKCQPEPAESVERRGINFIRDGVS